MSSNKYKSLDCRDVNRSGLAIRIAGETTSSDI